MTMQRTKSARTIYREEQGQRVKGSATLATKFKQLKSLTADLTFLDVHSPAISRNLKCSVNLDNAKSVFRYSCPNDECVQGDFDLTDIIAQAVTKGQTAVTGEIPCPGWLSKTTIGSAHCNNRLHYNLKLTY
jgi:hypothetical protein